LSRIATPIPSHVACLPPPRNNINRLFLPSHSKTRLSPTGAVSIFCQAHHITRNGLDSHYASWPSCNVIVFLPACCCCLPLAGFTSTQAAQHAEPDIGNKSTFFVFYFRRSWGESECIVLAGGYGPGDRPRSQS
jgi:hypothetical protein